MKALCRISLAAVLATPISALAVIGPDVTVSTIDNFTKYGTVGNITGFAMTTVSCNLGDRQAIWIDCTNPNDRNCNQHPVIAQTMYKLYTGANGATRFEQIGSGWLKHGFCGADASGPNCAGSGPGFPAACNNDGTCDGLGVGCTDTYGAGLNADQQDLGPRSEINAYSGYYPYPYVRNWNLTGNAIYKRLQVANADLVANPSLTTLPKYFAECQYIVTDEAAAVRMNNVTYRQLIVSGTTSNPNASFSTPGTVPRQPALNAWAANDTGVSIATIDLPNDGRIMLGYKVTQLPNGNWNYEYALYNMNSHQSVRSFTVPAPDWHSFTNQGFHDVPYHSGEIFDGTDWAAVKTPAELTWSTQTNAQNLAANALRWGCVYNFRFETNSPPGPGQIKLGLFQGVTQVLATPSAPNPTIVPPPAAPVIVNALVPQFKGDMNCDNLFNNLDIDPYVLALTFPDQYAAQFPGCNSLNGDMNNDAFLNNFDIDAFVNALIGTP